MSSASGMNVDYINPFIEATVSTFQSMCSLAVAREKVFLKGNDQVNYGVSGIIGLAGEAQGAVVLSFPEDTARKVISKLVGEDFDSINAAVVDGVGELTNIVAGDAKNRLVQKGYKFDLGLPRIVSGRSHIAAQSRGVQCLVITFKSECGPFSLEVSLKKNG